MSNIVFTHEQPTNYNNDESWLPGHAVILKNKDTIFRNENAVVLVESVLRTGLNRYSGKRWYRWNVDQRYGFYRNKNGLIIPFHKVGQEYRRPSHPFYLLTPRPWHWNNETRDAWRQYAGEYGVHSLGDVFPIAGMYQLNTYEWMPFGYTRAFRNSSFPGYLREVYKQKPRKDLVKAAANAPAIHAVFASYFRNLVPIDWIIGFLRENADEPNDPNELRMHRDDYDQIIYRSSALRYMPQLLGSLDPRSYKHLLKQRVRNWIAIEDILYSVAQGRRPENTYLRTWAQVHDQIAAFRYNYNHKAIPFEDKEVKWIPIAKAVAGSVSNLEIQPVQHTSEMVEWGQAMNNCISGYRQRAISGEGVYGAIYRDGALYANFEIAGNDLRQLLGKYNKVIAQNDRKVLERYFRSRGIKVGKYWGSDDAELEI